MASSNITRGFVDEKLTHVLHSAQRWKKAKTLDIQSLSRSHIQAYFTSPSPQPPGSISLSQKNTQMEAEKDNQNKKGLWTEEEDRILLEYIRVHGRGKWNRIPKVTGKKLN
jgi:hypothetical protein